MTDKSNPRTKENTEGITEERQVVFTETGTVGNLRKKMLRGLDPDRSVNYT